jgi:hypothetical protein
MKALEDAGARIFSRRDSVFLVCEKDHPDG